jgi:hypothetical protein
VLTDQPDILSQLERNVHVNFGTGETTTTTTTARGGGRGGGEGDDGDDYGGGGGGGGGDGPRRRRNARGGATIRAMPLSWSRDGARRLAEDVGREGGGGFDVVVNCDCVYEPLYGKR